MEVNNPPAVEIKGLTKSFGRQLALKAVDLTVGEGEFLILVGPNGAGKTTLLRVLATIARPSSGDIQVDGFRLDKESNEIRRRIGFVPHQTLLYEDLTAYENLQFYGRMYDVTNLDQRIQELTEKMGMSSQLHRLVRTLSRGTHQRFSIIRALLHEPSLLLLDEPETGLDRRASAMLIDILKDSKKTIIMASHRLEKGLELADRVAMLASGRVKYEDSTKSLDPISFAELYIRYTEGE